MEHLDPDEEDEEGEASANARNKAISSLLGGPSPKNHHAPVVDTEDDESDGDEKTPGVSNLKHLGYRAQGGRSVVVL